MRRPLNDSEANRSGEIGRQIFEGCWKDLGIKVVDDHPAYHGAQMFSRDECIVIRKPVDEHERKARAQYLYKNYAQNVDVLFDVRSQTIGGSTDEKLIRIIEQLADCVYPDCCVVLIGNGFRAQVRQEADRRAKELSRGNNKRIRVINAVGDVLYRKLAHLVERGTFPN